jgi:hypothetical protein
MTLGKTRVRASFNPSNNNLVDEIKDETAKLIDLCEKHKTKDPEEARLWSLAQTHYEDAAMWAVKAATSDASKGGK